MSAEKAEMIVANEGRNVLVNYNYMLRVEGVFDLPCKAVHSFTKENEFEYLQEGGLNDYVHMLRKPISKPFTFTVERYVGTDIYSPLPLGAELVLPVILMVAPHPNRFDISKRTFVFTGCTVMGKTYGELNAEKSGILTETIVIGYREMLEVTIPMVTGDGAKKWAFTKKEDVKGNEQCSARELDVPKDAQKPKQRYWKMQNKAEAEKNAVSAANADGTNVTPNNGQRVLISSAARNGIDTNKPPQRHFVLSKISEAKKNRAAAAEAAAQGTAASVQSKEVSSSARVLVTSATQNGLDAKLPTIRKWETVDDKKLGGGTASAKKNTDLDKAKPKSRYWNLNQAVKNAKAENAPADATQTAAEGTTPAKDTTQSGRAWKASAVRNTLDANRAKGRKWETAGDNQLGGGKVSAKKNEDLDKAKPKSRYWNLNQAVKNAKAENAPADAVQTAAEGTTPVENAAESGRIWKASAVLNKTDSTYAKVRKWETANDEKLGGGTSSAKKNEDLDKAKPKSRYWSLNQAVKNTKAENAPADAVQTAAEGTTPAESAAESGRTWKASAVRNTLDANRATARKWETSGDNQLGGGKVSAQQAPTGTAKARKWETADDNRLGGGTASAQQAPTSAAKVRKWETSGDNQLGGGTASAQQAPANKAKARKWETSEDNKLGGGTASARKAPTSAAKARKWETADDNQLGGGAVSAKQAPVSAAKARKWETSGDGKLGGGTASANQSPASAAKPRKWDGSTGGSAKKNESDGKKAANRKWLIKNTESNRSAVTENASKATARRWETAEDGKLGGGKASANQSPNSKASARKWETAGDNRLGGGAASANQSPNSTASARKWEMQGGTASANQSPSTKAEGRKWPAVSSARKRQE